MLGLLKAAAKQFQQTIILITHDHDIAQLADRIVRIEDGRLAKEQILMVQNRSSTSTDLSASGGDGYAEK